MKPGRLLMLLVCMLLTGISAAWAQDVESECPLVYLFDGWARATVEGAPNSAAYGLLINLTDEEDTLLSAATEAAEAVELHEMVMGADDVMQMNPVEGGLTVGAHHFLELMPGGFHIMLINVQEPLVAGEMLPLTLTFEKAGEIQLEVPIRDADAMEAMEMADDPMGDDMGGMDEMGEAMDWPEGCAGIHILDPWVRPAGAGTPNSAAYALLLNLTAEVDTLITVSTEAAEVSELHEMVMGAGDVMQMRPIEGGIVVPPGGTAHLKPGGLHMMLINLTGELEAGSMIELTLIFEQSGEFNLTVPVRDPDAEGAMEGMHGG